MAMYLADCLRACVMRDKSMMNKFQIAKVPETGEPSVSEPFTVATSWGYEKYRNPAEFAPGTW